MAKTKIPKYTSALSIIGCPNSIIGNTRERGGWFKWIFSNLDQNVPSGACVGAFDGADFMFGRSCPAVLAPETNSLEQFGNGQNCFCGIGIPKWSYVSP